MLARRITKEKKELEKDPLPGITLNMKGEKINKWSATIEGPEDTPYDGYIYSLNVNLSDKYPMECPKISFSHSMYHPNISTNGDICLDILQSQYSPTLTLGKILLSISSLLGDPNPNSPLNGEAARLWKGNRDEYNRKVREFSEKYCEKK